MSMCEYVYIYIYNINSAVQYIVQEDGSIRCWSYVLQYLLITRITYVYYTINTNSNLNSNRTHRSIQYNSRLYRLKGCINKNKII